MILRGVLQQSQQHQKFNGTTYISNVVICHFWHQHHFQLKSLHQKHTNIGFVNTRKCFIPKHTNSQFSHKNTSIHDFDTRLKVLTPAPHVVYVANMKYGSGLHLLVVAELNFC